MDQRREKLDKILRGVIGNGNVYFQPPPSHKMQYPCIRYSYSGQVNGPADDHNYIRTPEWKIVYIDRSPTLGTVEKLLNLPSSSVVATYQADGLNHTVITLYY